MDPSRPISNSIEGESTEGITAAFSTLRADTATFLALAAWTMLHSRKSGRCSRWGGRVVQVNIEPRPILLRRLDLSDTPGLLGAFGNSPGRGSLMLHVLKVILQTNASSSACRSNPNFKTWCRFLPVLLKRAAVVQMAHKQDTIDRYGFCSSWRCGSGLGNCAAWRRRSEKALTHRHRKAGRIGDEFWRLQCVLPKKGRDEERGDGEGEGWGGGGGGGGVTIFCQNLRP